MRKPLNRALCGEGRKRLLFLWKRCAYVIAIIVAPRALGCDFNELASWRLRPPPATFCYTPRCSQLEARTMHVVYICQANPMVDPPAAVKIYHISFTLSCCCPLTTLSPSSTGRFHINIATLSLRFYYAADHKILGMWMDCIWQFMKCDINIIFIRWWSQRNDDRWVISVRVAFNRLSFFGYDFPVECCGCEREQMLIMPRLCVYDLGILSDYRTE